MKCKTVIQKHFALKGPNRELPFVWPENNIGHRNHKYTTKHFAVINILV
jgi:hypothetical protein